MLKSIAIIFVIALPAIFIYNRNNYNPSVISDVTVINKWDVPPVLREISGIAWMSDNRFACVQDEDGIIYIYNTASSSIEKEVHFAGPGDFEGLTFAGDVAYAMRSDGRLFEINNINNSKPRVYEYKTHLVAENDVEGLTYDKANNRLLVAIKGSEANIRTYKGIYAFNLASKTMSETPVYKIELSDKMFKSLNANKVNNIMQPSEIAVHPGTGEIFITDAISGTLIKLNKRGSITRLYRMPLKEFSKAEGMTFSPGGKLFIANEGKKKPGNILEVRLNN